MKIVQVRCPSCANPIQMKEVDRFLLCDKCGTMHVRDGGVQKLDYEIADFPPGVEGTKVYVPFWRLYVSFTIQSKEVKGGNLHRLGRWLKGDSDSGDMFVYVPAAEMDIGTFKRLAVDTTLSPPRYATRMDFGGVRRVPSVMGKDEAAEMADFVIVTMEAEEPGVLQRLNYTLEVKDARVVYLPFSKGPSGMAPAYR